MSNSLLVVHVDVSVLPDHIKYFLVATEMNANESRLEPGVVRFDVLRDRDEASHVVLVEIYRDDEAAAAHKTTAHYAEWRDVVAPMMARSRESTRFVNVSPDDTEW